MSAPQGPSGDQPPGEATDATGSADTSVPEQRPTPSGADAQTEELDQLRSQLEELRGRMSDRERRARRTLTIRRIVAAVLVAIAAFGTTASVVGLWAARTTLNTDRWVSTVGPLPSNPKVAKAVSVYVTDQLFRVLDVEDRVAEALPPNAAFIATPVTDGVRNYLQGTVDDVLRTPEFQELWLNLNRTAHDRILAIIEGESNTVSVQGDRVTLNLLPVINNVLATLEDRAPTLFGKTLNLPTITNGQVPAGLENRIETALGVNLPPDFSQITIYRENELSALQDWVNAFKKYLALLVIGTLVVLALALWVSPWRRRTILQYGVWLAIAVLAVGAAVRAVRDQILDDVPAGTFREGTAAAIQIVFKTLRERADQLVWLGIAIALIAYLVGPGRAPRWLRRAVVTGFRASVSWVRGLATGAESSDWVRERLDPLRIGGVVVAGLIALLLTSWTSLFVILVLLGAYELAITLIAQPRGAAPETPSTRTAEPSVPTQPGAPDRQVAHAGAEGRPESGPDA